MEGFPNTGKAAGVGQGKRPWCCKPFLMDNGFVGEGGKIRQAIPPLGPG